MIKISITSFFLLSLFSYVNLCSANNSDFIFLPHKKKIFINNHVFILGDIAILKYEYTCDTNLFSWDCGRMAWMALANVISKEMIRCSTQSQNNKNEPQILTPKCTVSGQTIRSWLVRNGWSLTQENSGRLFELDEQYAKENQLGLWRYNFKPPNSWRSNSKMDCGICKERRNNAQRKRKT